MNIDAYLDQVESNEVRSQLNDRFCRVAELFAFDVSREEAEKRIYGFLIRYIKATISSMQTLRQLGCRHNITELLEPYLQFASSHINAASDELEKQTDSLHRFLTLLQAAYVFHRMAEELDDRIQHFIGIPLTHLNSMNANLIAHEIIGDRFANRLDGIVISLFRQAKITKALIEAQLDPHLIETLRKSKKALSGQPVRCFAADNQLALFAGLRIS